MNRQHILVIRLSALGDVAMTIPAIYSVARAYPWCTFHMLTSEWCGHLFIYAPTNVTIHSLPTPDLHGVRTTLRLLTFVRRIPTDVVADLHCVLRSWIVDAFCLLRGKNVAVLDKHRLERRAILNQHQCASQSYVSRYFEVFARLGFHCEQSFTSLFSNALPVLPDGFPKYQRRTWVGIAPFARYKNKTYPIQQMRTVAEHLATEGDKEIFLFGSKGKETELLSSWCKYSPHIHCLAGQFTLSEELALMAHLDVMVAMDSANMHLASLVGVRVISIWGSTTPACGFMGWQQRDTDAVVAGLPCQPCTIAGSEHCSRGDFLCLTSLSPICLINKIKSTIKQQRKQAR
ncbi:MAG: glycosyltransferase family 9 protein [Prevotella sp.]|nr:glycosyltransferase family 9 protein [Prevotella sp.]